MKDLLFFIAILPNEDIQQEVTGFKEYMQEYFDASHALKSPPHITLFPPFKWNANRVNDLTQTLAYFAADYNSFTLQLNNFNSFPPRVLFVDVEKSEQLQGLQQNLQKYLLTKLHLVNDRDHPNFNPHMTIAHKDLKRALYPKAWAHFSKQTYRRAFHVSTITLLEHKGGRWEVYEEFGLGN